MEVDRYSPPAPDGGTNYRCMGCGATQLEVMTTRKLVNKDWTAHGRWDGVEERIMKEQAQKAGLTFERKRVF
jgi:hypothetical protein